MFANLLDLMGSSQTFRAIARKRTCRLRALAMSRFAPRSCVISVSFRVTLVLRFGNVVFVDDVVADLQGPRKQGRRTTRFHSINGSEMNSQQLSLKKKRLLSVQLLGTMMRNAFKCRRRPPRPAAAAATFIMVTREYERDPNQERGGIYGALGRLQSGGAFHK